MKEIQLTITALSPLAIGRHKPGGSISEVQTHIPGSVIRGAIAAQILRQSPDAGEQPGGDFQALFLSEQAAVFSNAYPTSKGRRSRVLPATAVSSKTAPGFCTDNAERTGKAANGVFDTLMDRFCSDAYGHLYDPGCPQDGGRIEPFGGFYSSAGNKYKSHSVETRLLTKVGINRRRATAQDNLLYSIEVINETQKNGKEDSVFSGSIRLADEKLADLLTEYINSSNFRLGGSASRGLGKVKVEANATDYRPTIAARIKAFNAKLSKRWQAWSLFGSPQEALPTDRTYFTLDLQSDAILTEQWRRTTAISPAMLCKMAEIEDDSDLALHTTYSSYDYSSGWNSAWGLMKDVELVTNKGAVYLFSTSNIDRWRPALEHLEARGIGERTPEGFGQIQVCSEFHQIFWETAV